jgi:signal transduction histidine kinase
VEPHSSLPAIAFDHERILQVFSELIENAVKFMKRNGKIRIGGRVSNGETVFSISDTGSGIPIEDIPHLFDRFRKSRQIANRGMGLGLYIAKGIVEGHGGHIWAESKVNHGSTFYFSLPNSLDLQIEAKENKSDLLHA